MKPATSKLQRDLERVVDTIVAKFDPDKVILFGSHAWGEPNADSDVDLFVVKDTEDTRTLRRDIDGTFFADRPFPMDILVYRPDRVAWRIKIEDPFIRKVLRDGKVLYDRVQRRP